MDDRAALEQEVAVLRERQARLSEAGARIAEELDLDVVLGEVMEAARALTGARFSGITLLDEAGELEQFITPEFSQQQYQAVMQMPGGETFFPPPPRTGGSAAAGRPGRLYRVARPGPLPAGAGRLLLPADPPPRPSCGQHPPVR